MAEIEITIGIVAPSLTGGFEVGGINWHLGNSDITKIEAKLSSGSGTFNAKKGDKHSGSLLFAVSNMLAKDPPVAPHGVKSM